MTDEVVEQFYEAIQSIIAMNKQSEKKMV